MKFMYKPKLLWILFFTVLIINACKKQDRIITSSPKSRAELFFTNTNALTPSIQKIYDALKKQNAKTHFVDQLPKDAGYPIWNKIKINSKKANTSRSTTNDTTVTAVIPLTNDNTYLSSLLKIEEVVSDSFKLNIYTNNYFYQKTHSNNLNTQNAQYLIGFFLKMDNSTFGTTKFRNIPKACFPGTNFVNSTSNTIPVLLDTIVYNTTNGRLSSFDNSEEPCWIVTLNFPICATPSLICCNGPNGCDLLAQGYCAGSGTQECKWASYSVDNCSAPDYDPGEPIGGGGPIGSSGPPVGPPTGGGGGGSGTGGSGTPPCGGTWYRPIEGCDGEVVVGGGIPDPCDPYIITLANDTAFTNRFAQLNSPNVTGGAVEQGYNVENQATKTYKFAQGNVAQPFINWTLQNPVNGILHNHYYNYNNIFSPDDILFMAKIYINGFARDSTNLFFGLTSNTGLPLIMKVKNPAKFRAFAQNIIDKQAKKNKKISDVYKDKLVTYDGDENIKQFFKMLKKEGGEGGLDLYEGSNDCKSWKKLRIDASGDIVRNNLCN